MGGGISWRRSRDRAGPFLLEFVRHLCFALPQPVDIWLGHGKNRRFVRHQRHDSNGRRLVGRSEGRREGFPLYQVLRKARTRNRV
jgi:hypothetical protein